MMMMLYQVTVFFSYTNKMSKYPSPFTQISKEVLKLIQQEFMHYQGSPFCFVEVSHRSANYDRLNNLTVDMIKKYFNAEDYEVLLMPIGTAMPCIYFNHIFPDNRVIFYCEGSFSSKNYEEMKKYHPETVKVSNEADLIDMLAEQKFFGKNIVHMNKIEDGRQINVELLGKHRKQIILAKNINYCFPWTETTAMDEDIVYFDSETGFSIAGFTVMLVKKQLINKLPIRENCPDMLDFVLMLKMKSVVNTPFTLCTLVLYHNLKYAYENKAKLCQQIANSKRQYQKLLLKMGCKKSIDNEEDKAEAFNFINRSYNQRDYDLMKQLGQFGWISKQNNEICLFIQSSTSDPNYRLCEKLNIAHQ